MATKTQTTQSDASGADAIALLTADHKRVKALFKQFENLKEDGDDEDKAALVEQICNELTIHAATEEEIFYPAVREAIEDADLMDEALVEHAGAKELIAQLRDASPDEDLYDAKVTVLGEQIDHHVKEEEGEMFPKAKKAKLDTAALGAQMLARKKAMQHELGIEDEESGAAADEEDQESTVSRQSAKRSVKSAKSR